MTDSVSISISLFLLNI